MRIPILAFYPENKISKRLRGIINRKLKESVGVYFCVLSLKNHDFRPEAMFLPFDFVLQIVTEGYLCKIHKPDAFFLH